MSLDEARSMLARNRELALKDPFTHEPELGLALYRVCQEMKNRGVVTNVYLDLLEEGIALHRKLLRRTGGTTAIRPLRFYSPDG